MQRRGFTFSQKSKVQTVENGKKQVFSVVSFQKFLTFINEYFWKMLNVS